MINVDQNKRRSLKTLLYSGLGVSTLGQLSGCSSLNTPKSELIGCAIRNVNEYQACAIDIKGQLQHSWPLPSRGHGVATHPTTNQATIFARRPGHYFIVVDVETGDYLHTIKPQRHRYFYGHGVYSKNGQFLYVTEGHVNNSRGYVGVYDARDKYQKVAEFTGFGIGPHEIILTPQNTLAVGVGGVHTKERKPLNISTMAPNLTYLGLNGEVLSQHTLPNSKLSIRHLAHDGIDTVFCGQQLRGGEDTTAPLVAIHQQGKELHYLQAEPEEWARFNGYIASITSNKDWIIATSPRGNCYGVWSRHSLTLEELHVLPDASGATNIKDKLYLSSGVGKVLAYSPMGELEPIRTSIQWDNHWKSL
ncbi:DUF1513 domain-containing protein [Vibrio sp.]|nr:DUF1513 domain-containing protein [Vibrio sp.]